MGNQEAVVRVVLDTKGAKAALGDLGRDGEKAAKRTSGPFGRAARAIGLGAGFGAGLGAARGALTSSLVSDVGTIIQQTLGPIGNQLANLALGREDRVDVRATQRAQQGVQDVFGFAAGVGGGDRVPDEIRTAASGLFSTLLRHYRAEELGKQLISEDPRFMTVAARQAQGATQSVIDHIDRGFQSIKTFLGVK